MARIQWALHSYVVGLLDSLSTWMDAMQAVETSAHHSKWLLGAPQEPCMDMGVQLMDLRSSMRATQHQGSSDGSRSSSNSTTNHHVVQHLVVQLVQQALRMRQLLLVECAVVGVGQSAAHGTLAAATRRRRQPGSTVYMQFQH